MKSLAATLVLVFLMGCNKPTAAPSTPAPAIVVKKDAPPPIPGLPYTFKVKQRSLNEIPDSELALLVDEIKRGVVLISLQTKKETFLQPVFVKEHDRKGFEYEKREYELVLTKLDNAEAAEASATFELRESPPAVGAPSAP